MSWKTKVGASALVGLAAASGGIAASQSGSNATPQASGSTITISSSGVDVDGKTVVSGDHLTPTDIAHALETIKAGGRVIVNLPPDKAMHTITDAAVDKALEKTRPGLVVIAEASTSAYDSSGGQSAEEALNALSKELGGATVVAGIANGLYINNNYPPKVTPLGDGKYEADGVVFNSNADGKGVVTSIAADSGVANNGSNAAMNVTPLDTPKANPVKTGGLAK